MESRVALAVALGTLALCALVAFLATVGAAPDAALNVLQLYAGLNVDTGYVYTLGTDCFGEGNECPAGQFCDVIARDNWYPWDTSFISRGRCLKYTAVGAACEVPGAPGLTAFPCKADGMYYERASLCEPGTICTGDTVGALPPQCIFSREPDTGCVSTTENGCAGRPSWAECPDAHFCVTPSRKFDIEKLEQCASLFNGFNGPSFSLGASLDGSGTHPGDMAAWRGNLILQI
ncbi:hypothetical protein T492DRAFT_838704 [Pavlovales sp. CCMP2436]|nr:hypothetical protein T492DRAFT_838704 [Pavlovales sp. CCMP2436]